MAKAKIFGIVVLIAGIVCLLFSAYIRRQVNEGKGQISDAQKKVKQADSMFSLNPFAKEVGKEITGSAQKKIDEGSQKVAHYTAVANGLQIGGFVLIAAGVLIIVFGGKKRKN